MRPTDVVVFDSKCVYVPLAFGTVGVLATG